MKAEKAREKAIAEQAEARKSKAKAKTERKEKAKQDEDQMARELDAQEEKK